MTIRIPLLFTAFYTSCQLVVAQQSLSAALEEFISDPSLQHAGIGVSVLDLQTGEDIAVYQPELSLIPASALKILTTATALAILGPDYQFQTELSYSGTVDAEGTLNGNLILTGYGDPTLGSDQMPGADDLETVMEKFRLAIQREGIRKIDGRIIADDSYFENAVNARSWQWNDLGNYYASGAWGLSIHENLYYLKFRQKPELKSTPGIIGTTPAIPGLEFANHLESAPRGTGDNAYIYGAPYTFLRYIRGTIPIGTQTFTIKGSIPDPPLFAAQYLRQKLAEIGIICSQAGTSIQASTRETETEGINTEISKTLYRHLSPPLQSIVNRANMRSVNLYCEHLLKTLGKTQNAEGSTTAGLEVVRTYWKEKGLDFSGCYLEDGSGLSPRNSVTASFLSGLLFRISAEPDLYRSFKTSLPVAGISGTLKSYLRNSPAKGKITAKTGTMDRVRAFTGYAATKNGKQLAVTVIVNNHAGKSSALKAKLERLLLHIYKY